MEHATGLLDEYSFRYGKNHKSGDIIKYCQDNSIFDHPGDFFYYTMPALAMPDQYRFDDPVKSYRFYYFFDKRHNIKCEWNRGRECPNWFTELLEKEQEILV